MSIKISPKTELSSDTVQADFRHNEFKERRIKQALYRVLKNKDKVERVYSIVVEQGEY